MGLSTKQARALEALLAGGSVVKAAEAANVHRNTVFRWLKGGAFRDRLDSALADRLAHLTLAWSGVVLSGPALAHGIMAGKFDASVSEQLRALELAHGILDFFLTRRDIDERFARMELLK